MLFLEPPSCFVLPFFFIEGGSAAAQLGEVSAPAGRQAGRAFPDLE